MTSLVRQFERMFRHWLVYPAFRRVFHNQAVALPLDLQSTRSILILRYDRLGDVIVTSAFVRRIRELNPSCDIGILLSSQNFPAGRMLKGITRRHVIGSSWLRVVQTVGEMRRHRYEVVLNLVFNRTTSGAIIANLVAPNGTKVGQGDPKYAFYYNAQLSLQRNTAMVEILFDYGRQAFGESFKAADLRYELDEGNEARSRVSGFLGPLGTRPVVVNISAGATERLPGRRQISDVVQHIRSVHRKPVVVVSGTENRGVRDQIVADANDPGVVGYPPQGNSAFEDVVALVRRSLLLISPDTSLIHVAGATGTPLVGLYTSRHAMAEWTPLGMPFEIVAAEEGRAVAEIPSADINGAVDRIISRGAANAGN